VVYQEKLQLKQGQAGCTFLLFLLPILFSFFNFGDMKREESIIQIQGVKKHFKNVKAVDGIDLHIKKGEYVALLGPNGAGKTTLVEMIEGIQQPDEGLISIKNMQWKKDDKALHRIIGLSLQETRFFEKLNVGETLKLFASFYNLDNRRVDEVLELVNLSHKRKAYVENLSGGQRQRLALGMALLNEPEVLLLDEPTTGLDPTARREVWEILEKLKKEFNTTLILTTHYMEEASFLCERIIIMYGGKILAQGTLRELLSKHIKGEVISFATDSALPSNHLPLPEKVQQIHFNENTMEGEIIVEDLVNYLPEFLAYMKKNGIQMHSLECRKMTLDDLFIAMTGKHLNE